MSTNSKVLLLDWGIGGLSVYNEVKRLRPDLSIVYVSDSGFTPYGKVPSPALATRVASIIAAAKKKWEVSFSVIACNAASTVLLEVRQIESDQKILGVIEAGVELMRECGKKRIGVIGGLRTIESKVFSKALAESQLEIRERIAQPLSALIESGILSGPTLQKELGSILAPLQGAEALLLACTHYPAVAGEIQKLLPNAQLLDPAARTAQYLSSALLHSNEPAEEDLFLTTGSAESTEKSADSAFGLRIKFSRWEMPGGR